MGALCLGFATVCAREPYLFPVRDLADGYAVAAFWRDIEILGGFLLLVRGLDRADCSARLRMRPVSFLYLSVESPFYKFYGINCRSKLGAKLLDRFFHRLRQVSPVVNYLTHRFFDGGYHLLDGDVAVSFHDSLASHFGAAVHRRGWHLV